MRNAHKIACHNYGAWCAQTPTVILPRRAPFRSNSGEGINPAVGHLCAFISIPRQEGDEQHERVRHSQAGSSVIQEMNVCLTTNIH